MKKMVTLGVVILVLITGTVWAYRRHRADAQVQNVLKLQEKAFDDKLPPDQREAMRTQIRTEMDKLSDRQRGQVRDQMGARFQRREDERMAAYFKMTAEQKAAYLSQQIADMLKRQQERDARRAADQAQNGANSQSQNGNGQNGNNSGGGNRPGRFDQQARNNFRLRMLDNTSPAQRAERAQYMQDFRQQCLQQGITPPTRGGPRGR